MIIAGQTFINNYAKKICTFNLFNVFIFYGNFYVILWFFISTSEQNKLSILILILRGIYPVLKLESTTFNKTLYLIRNLYCRTGIFYTISNIVHISAVQYDLRCNKVFAVHHFCSFSYSQMRRTS